MAVTCNQVYFSSDRTEKVRRIQFLNESSAGSPESGLNSDWPKNNRAFRPSLQLVTTELQKNWLTADQIMAGE